MAVKNKKVAAGVGISAAVAAVLALGAGTFAAFFDSTTAPRTTLATGTLFFDDPVEGTLVELGPLTPGAPIAPQTVSLTNGGNLPGRITLDFTGSPREDGCAGGPGGPEIAVDPDCANLSSGGELGDQIRVVITRDDIAAPLFNGLAKDLSGIFPTNPVAAGQTVVYTVTYSFPDLPLPAGNNAAQGDRLIVDLVANLRQI